MWASILLKIKELLQIAIQDFINQQLDKPAADLLFLAKKYPEWDMAAIAQQVEGKQKAKHKLASWFKQKQLLYPSRLSMEQCSSELSARYKAQICQGDRFIDLTGGFGVDSYFIAQSFNEATHCELNSQLQAIATHNFKALEANIQSFNEDGLKHLENSHKPFDLIYLDPARRSDENKKVIRLEDYTPNVLEHLDLLFEKGEYILLKTAPLLDIKQAFNQLKSVHSIHVVSIKNECKEVLYLLKKESEKQTLIHCVDLAKEHSFSFKYEEEKIPCSKSLPLNYLYEPNAAILKAGAFNSIGNAFKLQKLHSNSHLYTSENFLSNFPGRVFSIDAIAKLNKKELAQLIPEKKAHISRRNFPLSVAQIRQKTALKEGGDKYLFATTLKNNKPTILLCSKV